MEEMIVARRIKQLRIEKGLTLESVAQRTGFTKGLLSKIENNKVSPPVSTLAKIARALETSLGALFSDADADQIKIVRQAERMVLRTENSPGGQVMETLMSGFAQQKIEPLLVTIGRPEDYVPNFFSHPGHEFIFVLSGGMGYVYDGAEYQVSEGDALYFEAEKTHGPKPIAGLAVRYLSVMCA